jgi:hypothetical protein
LKAAANNPTIINVLINIFSRRTDRCCVGSTLHLALCEIPMPDFGPETHKAKQYRQYHCCHNGNSTR